MQISEKRNNLSLKSEKGKRRLSGWDNIIWKLKKIPNAPLSLPPHPFESGGGQNPPSSAKQISADRLLGEKSVSRLSGSARGKNFGAIKLKTFFSQFWKKPSFRHERDQRSSGESGQEAQRRGDFSPAARAGARCEYILCLPVLPSSVAKVSRLEQTREEGGRKGRGVRRVT